VDEEMEEVEEMEEIELSSDEDEADDDEVSLIVLKRPPITERVIEEVEVRKLILLKTQRYEELFSFFKCSRFF
jgi:hypothetical protein